MKKVPSALKWLVEKRARIAGEIKCCQQVLAVLAGESENLRFRLADAEMLQGSAQMRLERITRELAAVDQTVLLYDSSICPDRIEPVNAWQGNYGKRGALRKFLLETLKSRGLEFTDTPTLAVLTITEFSLVFEHPTARAHWFRGSFKTTIKVLAAQGLIEPSHDRLVNAGTAGSWRWKQEKAQTLAELRLDPSR